MVVALSGSVSAILASPGISPIPPGDERSKGRCMELAHPAP